MSRPVSLAMYDAGGLATATLWLRLREHLGDEGFDDLPEELEIPADYEAHWLAPDLLLAQTCGYPLSHALAGRVRYLGTPIYDVPGTDGANYRSAIVVRSDDPAEDLRDLRGRRAAYNSVTSQSGYNAFRDLVATFADGKPFFSNVVQSGSHAASLELIITDKADISTIDPVSLALAPDKIRSQIKVIGWSNAVPGLPLITSASSTNDDVNRLNRAISHALRDPLLAEPLAYLKLRGFEILPEEAYDLVPQMERRAIDRGYPLLA
jgi:ABC-type phosphate/phosphonate transport system substrate-binding protein